MGPGQIVFCNIHPNTKMVCPRCIAAAGGKKTAKRHSDKLAIWGKRGGKTKRKKKNRKET